MENCQFTIQNNYGYAVTNVPKQKQPLSRLCHFSTSKVMIIASICNPAAKTLLNFLILSAAHSAVVLLPDDRRGGRQMGVMS